MASSTRRSLSTTLTLGLKHARLIMRNYHRGAVLKMSGIQFFGWRYRSTLPKKFCNPPLTPPLLRQASTRTPSGVSPLQTSNGIEQASALYHSHPDSPGAGGLQAQ